MAEAMTAESVADVDDLAEAGPELLAATARLADDLAQAFGVAELGQVTRQGEFRIRYWSRRDHHQIRTWAEARGIAVTDEVLG